MLRIHPDLFYDPKSQHPIDDLSLPFADYIDQCRDIIANTRVDLKVNAENIISANSPFELRPRNKAKAGVLLIHGLLESPFAMKDIGMGLQENGFLVRAILLPGHGTVPGDLLSVKYEEWIQAMRYGIATLAKETDEIYIIGTSTGAALALYHILHEVNIAGAVLISPAIKIRSAIDFASNWHNVISWKWERAKWLSVEKENDYAKYQSLAFNAIHQVYSLTRLVDSLSQTNSATCRQLFALSMADSTVSASASIKYFHEHARSDNEMILYSSKDTHQNDPNTIVRSSVYPDMHIRSFSHICVHISPNNPHYGMQGDYINASHVKETKHTVYGGFSKLYDGLYDFLYQNKFTKVERKRLTFNPDFEFLMQKINSFCEPHPKTTSQHPHKLRNQQC